MILRLIPVSSQKSVSVQDKVHSFVMVKSLDISIPINIEGCACYNTEFPFLPMPVLVEVSLAHCVISIVYYVVSKSYRKNLSALIVYW